MKKVVDLFKLKYNNIMITNNKRSTLMIKLKAYIFDIDGVVSNPSHRMHLHSKIIFANNAKEKLKAVDDFVSLSHLDEPFKHVCKVCYEISVNSQILFLTGRPEKFREITLEWIEKHLKMNNTWFRLYMKPDGDTTKSVDFKKKVFDEQISKMFDVIGVFEDRNETVKMWRDIGLTCFALPSIFD